MRLITLDVESFWSPTYSLSKMSPLEYVMGDEFELISLGIKVDDHPTDVFFGEDDIRAKLAAVHSLWDNAFAIAHNMSGFDAYVLAYYLGIRPKMWGCTLAMARPIHAKTCGVSLAALVKHYGLGVKDSAALINTRGKRLADFTGAEMLAMEEYNRDDTDQCHGLFHKLKGHYTAQELWQIDSTIRMRTEPAFELDVPLLRKTAAEEKVRKHEALLDLSAKLNLGTFASDDEAVENVRAELASAPRFAALLESLNVDVPMKPSPTNPEKTIPALAKTDQAFIDLQEHENEVVAAAARARLDVKSTILETRIQKFLTAGSLAGGRLPVPLRYCGADTTGRDSGEEYNCQALTRVDPDRPKPSDALRMSLRAPAGKKVIMADQSGIELRINHFLWKVAESMALYQASPDKADLYRAFASTYYSKAPADISKPERQFGKVCVLEGTLVLTDQGEIPIEQVTARHKVWDGIEWVSTMGAVFKGVKDVITYDGLTATPDHEVWVEDGRKVPFGAAAAQPLRLARAGTDRGTLEPAAMQTQGRVWDLLNCGPRSRFTANGRLVSNCMLLLQFGGGAKTFMNTARVTGGINLDLEESSRAVAAWRLKYADIVAGWKTCGKALGDIAAGREAPVDPWGLIHTCKEGFVLPSGRLIRYPDLRQEENGTWDDGRVKMNWVYAHGRHKAFIHSAKAEENLIQSLARDSVFDCSLEFYRRTGLRPALRVHDELVYVVDEAPAQDLLAELQSIMRTPPKWWPELVVWSEGDAADCYGEAKS